MIFLGFGILVGALFCTAEAVIGLYMKAGAHKGMESEQMLRQGKGRDELRRGIAAEVSNPENKTERRWLFGAAVLMALGLLLVFSPLLSKFG